eukprot:scaffold903_cov262-Pinguiococcus_pyrenoidosus.AAC.27
MSTSADPREGGYVAVPDKSSSSTGRLAGATRVGTEPGLDASAPVVCMAMVRMLRLAAVLLAGGLPSACGFARQVTSFAFFNCGSSDQPLRRSFRCRPPA